MSTTAERKPVHASIEMERECVRFLYDEAALLDDTKYLEWYETCLSDDLAYLVPVRTTRERSSGTSEFSDVIFHMKENKGSMRVRIDRLLTEHAWAEDPPSRTRRLVTNIRVDELGPDEAAASNYLALYRSQWDSADHDLLMAERKDVLRRESGEWRLLERTVLFSHTTLATPNLGVFL